MKKIFVAGLYSKNKEGEPASVSEIMTNIGRGEAAASYLFRNGYAVFCPWHDKSTMMDPLNFNIDVEHYYNASIAWLEVSDAMMVISGAGVGTGVDEEIERAAALEIPVFYEYEDLFDYFDQMERDQALKIELDRITNMALSEMLSMVIGCKGQLGREFSIEGIKHFLNRFNKEVETVIFIAS